MRAVILVVLAALVFRAEARIGETEEQCVGRYGKVIRREHKEKPPAEVTSFFCCDVIQDLFFEPLRAITQ